MEPRFCAAFTMRLTIYLVLLVELHWLPTAGHCDPAANTNSPPTDALVFLGAVREETMLGFKGYIRSADGQIAVKINVNIFEYTYFVRIGETVEDKTRKTNYKVVKFEPALQEEFDSFTNSKRQKDVSRVTLLRLDDGETVVLTLGVKYLDARFRAKLRNRQTDQLITILRSETIKLNDQTYEVVEIKEDGVLLTDSLKRAFSIMRP